MGKVTFCRTNAGKDFNISVNDPWLYVSEKLLLEVIDGKTKLCIQLPVILF